MVCACVAWRGVDPQKPGLRLYFFSSLFFFLCFLLLEARDALGLH